MNVGSGVKASVLMDVGSLSGVVQNSAVQMWRYADVVCGYNER